MILCPLCGTVPGRSVRTASSERKCQCGALVVSSESLLDRMGYREHVPTGGRHRTELRGRGGNAEVFVIDDGPPMVYEPVGETYFEGDEADVRESVGFVVSQWVMTS